MTTFFERTTLTAQTQTGKIVFNREIHDFFPEPMQQNPPLKLKCCPNSLQRATLTALARVNTAFTLISFTRFVCNRESHISADPARGHCAIHTCFCLYVRARICSTVGWITSRVFCWRWQPGTVLYSPPRAIDSNFAYPRNVERKPTKHIENCRCSSCSSKLG